MKSITDALLSNQHSEEDISRIKNILVTKKIPKGTTLQLPGEKVSNSYFVKKGLLRSYTIDVKGKEHIFMFAPEGWIIADIESHAYHSPAELYIDALENSEIEVIDRNVLAGLMSSTESIKNQFTQLTRRIGVLQKRVIMLMSASAKERYHHFLETYPDIVNRVPQKMIASYLGITPEALSKLRGEELRKK